MEAIRISGSSLKNAGFIKEEYIEEMIKNVEQNGSYMVVNDIVALPHARTENLVNKTGMSLLVIKNKVIFPDNKKVKLVLSFSSFDQKEHIDALTKFVTLLENKEFIRNVEKLDEIKIKEIIDKY